MSKYIDSEKLIAEIENTIKAAKKEMKDRDVDSYSDSPYDEKIYARINSTIETCEDIIDTITSLQQEQPEVELEKEYNEQWGGYTHDGLSATIDRVEFEQLAHHFYELGLNARKK